MFRISDLHNSHPKTQTMLLSLLILVQPKINPELVLDDFVNKDIKIFNSAYAFRYLAEDTNSDPVAAIESRFYNHERLKINDLARIIRNRKGYFIKLGDSFMCVGKARSIKKCEGEKYDLFLFKPSTFGWMIQRGKDCWTQVGFDTVKMEACTESAAQVFDFKLHNSMTQCEQLAADMEKSNDEEKKLEDERMKLNRISQANGNSSDKENNKDSDYESFRNKRNGNRQDYGQYNDRANNGPNKCGNNRMNNRENNKTIDRIADGSNNGPSDRKTVGSNDILDDNDKTETDKRSETAKMLENVINDLIDKRHADLPNLHTPANTNTPNPMYSPPPPSNNVMPQWIPRNPEIDYQNTQKVGNFSEDPYFDKYKQPPRDYSNMPPRNQYDNDRNDINTNLDNSMLQDNQKSTKQRRPEDVSRTPENRPNASNIPTLNRVKQLVNEYEQPNTQQKYDKIALPEKRNSNQNPYGDINSIRYNSNNTPKSDNNTMESRLRDLPIRVIRKADAMANNAINRAGNVKERVVSELPDNSTSKTQSGLFSSLANRLPDFHKKLGDANAK